MNNLDLIEMANQLLSINEQFKNHLDNPKLTISDFNLFDFDQWWGNTSGGIQGWGGDALSCQRTYVFVPNDIKEKCLVFFQDKFGYSCPYSEVFMEDVKNHRIAGCADKEKYNI